MKVKVWILLNCQVLVYGEGQALVTTWFTISGTCSIVPVLKRQLFYIMAACGVVAL